MANETIVPRKDVNLNLFNGTPNLDGVSVPRTGQFAGIGSIDPVPQVEWTPPARSNSLLQISDALGDLNPQLKAFGTAFVRDQSVQQKLQEEMAQNDANIIEFDNARMVGLSEIKDLVANGDIKAEQTPQYYTSLQKFSGERVARSDFYNYVMSSKDSTTGQLKYANRLNDGNSTEDVWDVLNEARDEWLSTFADKSAIFRNSASEAINKMSVGIAERAVNSRWDDRKVKMTETLVSEGQSLLTENENEGVDWEKNTQEWLSRTKYVPGAVTIWARDSLSPYVMRMAQENPDGARSLLMKYENLRTTTGAKLGGGANFETFQRAYATISEIEKRQESKNSRTEKLWAISDHISNEIAKKMDELGGDSSKLLDNSVVEDIRSKVYGKDVVIQTENGSSFRLDENSGLYGKTREMFDKAISDSIRSSGRENKELIAKFRLYMAEGDLEKAEQLHSAISDIGGWELNGKNSSAQATIDLRNAKNGIGIYNDKGVKESVETIHSFISQAVGAGKDGSPEAMQAVMDVASKDSIRKMLVDELKVSVDEAKKENPDANEFEAVRLNLSQKSIKVRDQLVKLAEDKVKKLENNVEKTQKQFQQAENAPEPSLGMFSMFSEKTQLYQGKSLPSPNTIEKLYQAQVKNSLKLKKAQMSVDSPNLTALDRRAIEDMQAYRAKTNQMADQVLELVAKDLQQGGYYSSGASSEGVPLFGSSPVFKKYSQDELVTKTEDYWRVKNIRGYNPEEIAKGVTREGITIPFEQRGDYIRNFALHFQSKQQFKEAVDQFKVTKSGVLDGIFKRYGLSTDQEQDSYLIQQGYLLDLLR
jgi:hypothetical protein